MMDWLLSLIPRLRGWILNCKLNGQGFIIREKLKINMCLVTRIFLYVVLGAISLGVGYIIREAFFGGAKKSKVRLSFIPMNVNQHSRT